MKFKNILFGLLICLIFFNLIFLFFRPDNLLSLKTKSLSLSKGEQYQSRLLIWQRLMTQNRVDEAKKMEKYLDEPHLAYHKKLYDPTTLKSRLNELIFLSNKTTDDYMEIARIQIRLNRNSEALEALKQAHILDPIRSDVDQLFYRLSE